MVGPPSDRFLIPGLLFVPCCWHSSMSLPQPYLRSGDPYLLLGRVKYTTSVARVDTRGLGTLKGQGIQVPHTYTHPSPPNQHIRGRGSDIASWLRRFLVTFGM